jgi:transposase-like protein
MWARSDLVPVHPANLGCKGCKRQFSLKVGTIFEDSPLGFDKWLPAIWLIANSKNSMSSHELGRSLGVMQRTAWFMLHRIRAAMASGSFEKMSGRRSHPQPRSSSCLPLLH